MRFFLISDSQETLHGLRLSGIEGIHVTERQDVLDALYKCLDDPGIAIILITGNLKAMCVKEVYSIMLERSLPLIVEIPAAGDVSPAGAGILDYIHKAIGLTL